MARLEPAGVMSWALVAAALIGAASPAQAEEAQPSQNGSSSSASARNTKDLGDGDANTIEDVVVTARKFEERAQAVPVSITALTGEQLEERGVQHVTDVQFSVPGLVFANTASSSFSPIVSMRGQTQGTLAISTDPSIGIYMDGVYLSGTTGLGGETMHDVARVEVLKGPQGTLFGRNTTGGAVSITTQAPIYDFEGQLTAGLGNYRRRAASAILNMPIVDEKLAVRLVASTSSHDGYGYDTARNVNVGDQDISNLRASVLFQPTTALQFVFRADWTSGKDNGLFAHPLYILNNPNTTAVQDAAVRLFGPGGNLAPANRSAALAAYQSLIALDRFKVRYNSPVFSGVETANYSMTATYDFGHAQLRSITASRRTKETKIYEIDGSDLILFDTFQPVHINQFTEELQLTGRAAGGRLTYAAGIFYYKLDGDDSNTNTQFAYLLNGLKTVTSAEVEAKSWATYVQGTYALTDSLNLTAGLRYTDETKSVYALGGTSSNAQPFTCSLPAALNPDLANCRVYVKTSGDNISYNLTADWSPVEQAMIYVRTARGFKSGTVNQRILGTNPLSGNIVQPEKVTDYEMGLKSDWLGGRLRINLAAYRSNYRDVQRQTIVCAPNCTSVLLNAAQATIKGVELDIVARPAAGLELGFSGATIDARYKRYLSGGLDNTRERFLETPKFSYTVHAGYTMPTSVGELRGQLNWAWRSDLDLAPQDYPGSPQVGAGNIVAYSNPGTPDSVRIQQGYGLLSGTLTLEIADHNATVRLFGNNLLNKKYISHALGLVGAAGLAIGTPGAPRTFGVDLTVKF